MKKWAVWLLTVMLVFSAFPALAEDARTSGDFQYTVKGNGTATIVEYTGVQKDIILPNLIDGYVITTIGPYAFFPRTGLGNSRDISVTLPDTVTTIGADAFASRRVYSINIPAALEYIDGNAFGSGEIQFRIANDHPHFATIDGSLYYKDNKELIYMAEYATIPNGIRVIANGACSIREAVKVPASVETIGKDAFSLAKRVSFEDGSKITEIPAGAFMFGEAINLPPNVTKVGERAFERAKLKQETFLHLIANLTEIGKYAFRDFDMSLPSRSLTIPGTLKVISEGALYHSDGMYPSDFDIREVTIEDGVERIETLAFTGLSIEKAYLPASLKDIALDAFDPGVKYTVEKGSYAERWVKENAFTYEVNGEEQNLDWLLN